jgi:hypothetical protein
MTEITKNLKQSGDVFLELLGEESLTYIKNVADSVAEMMVAAKKLTEYTNQFETKVINETNSLHRHIEKLEKEIVILKQKTNIV